MVEFTQPSENWRRRITSIFWYVDDIFNLPELNQRVRNAATNIQAGHIVLDRATSRLLNGWTEDLLAEYPGALNGEMEAASAIEAAIAFGITNQEDGSRSDTLIDSAAQISNWTFRRTRYVDQLAGAFLAFSFQQFAFIYDGFYRNRYVRFQQLDQAALTRLTGEDHPWWPRFQASLGDPAGISYPLTDYALRTTLEQITTDLFILRQLRTQTEQAALSHTLLLADDLALGVQQALANHLSSQVQSLTYVRDAAAIRVIPYAPIAPIGIPASSLTLKRDLLAIPHEFGHYLYWNGFRASSGPSFRNQIQTFFSDREISSGPLHRWREEIFADVVGGAVGGLPVALSFQDLSQEYAGLGFIDRGDRHPAPAVRPFIYCRVLMRRGAIEEARWLARRWCDLLIERQLADTQTSSRVQSDLSFSMSPNFIAFLNGLIGDRVEPVKLALRLQEMVDLDLLLSLVDQIDDWLEIPSNHVWQSMPRLPAFLTDPEVVYAQFEAWIFQTIGSREADHLSLDPPDPLPGWAALVAALTQSGDHSILQSQPRMQNPAWVAEVLYDTDMVLDDGENRVDIPADQWLPILFFDGWNTGGPGGGISHD